MEQLPVPRMVWGVLALLGLCLPVSLTSCNDWIFEKPGEMSVLFYNPDYRPGTNCTWTVRTPPGYLLHAQCSLRNIVNPDGSCDLHFIDNGTRVCASPTFQSRADVLLLELNPSSNSLGGGFSCRFSSFDCYCGGTSRQRIVGGKETSVNEFPMMASLVENPGKHFCGAAIISPRHVLTAAHCLDDLEPQDVGILVGAHDLTSDLEMNAAVTLYGADEFIYHPGYDRHNVTNDIGLIVSDEVIRFTKIVGPACLPYGRPDFPTLEEFVTVAGWGSRAVHSRTLNTLHKVDLQVIKGSSCRQTFGSHDDDTQLCTYTAGRKDACEGDSGGPLLIREPETSRYFLVGLVSFGSGCGDRVPAVSTKVYPYLDWIEAHTKRAFCIKWPVVQPHSTSPFQLNHALPDSFMSAQSL